MDTLEKMRHRIGLSNTFSPSAPVGKLTFFSGRESQLDRVTEAIFQRGQHAVIYGERGVGKTSLANVLADWLKFLNKFNYQIVRHNCAATSTFNSIWEGIFRELSYTRSEAGFLGAEISVPMSSFIPANAGPEDIRFLLQQTGSSTVVILDEYDRVPKASAASGLLADTIKSLSDHSVDATLIIIGVGDSIDDLIAEHKSVERALIQIKMPRMLDDELFSILEKGFSQAEMSIDFTARGQIAALSQGLPHNTHELGLLTGYACLDADRLNAGKDDVETAIRKAVENAQQTIVASYCQAITSPHQNIYKEILLAAALAKTDDLGYFAAGDLRRPLARIIHKDYGIDRFMRHLNSFCDESRGRVLEKRGERRKYRFRFTESIMEPYVIMRGIADGMINKDEVADFESEGSRLNSPLLF